MVGRWISFWEGLFSGAMLVLGKVNKGTLGVLTLWFLNFITLSRKKCETKHPNWPASFFLRLPSFLDVHPMFIFFVNILDAYKSNGKRCGKPGKPTLRRLEVQGTNHAWKKIFQWSPPGMYIFVLYQKNMYKYQWKHVHVTYIYI